MTKQLIKAIMANPKTNQTEIIEDYDPTVVAGVVEALKTQGWTEVPDPPSEKVA